MWYTKTVSLEFILFLFVVVHCKDPPVLLAPVKSQYTVHEGRNVKLRCKFSGTKDPPENRTLTAWRKLPEGPYITNQLPRFKKRLQYLKIKKVEPSDEGVYACIAYNPFGKIKQEIRLVVRGSNTNVTTDSGKTPSPIPITPVLEITAREPPIKSTTDRPMRISVGGPSQKPLPLIDEYPPKFKVPRNRILEYVKGHPIRLKCHATGAAPLNVTWAKNGKPLSRNHRSHLKSKGWVLSFKELTNDDTGTYSCIVRNAYGSIDKTFDVKVIESKNEVRFPPEEKPKILRNVLKNETAMEGEDVTFVCSAVAKSHPDFHLLKWKPPRNVSNDTDPFDFVDFRKSKYQEIRESAKQHIGNRKLYTHRFIVRNVMLADEARYTCVVGNSAGFVSQNVFLIVTTHDDEGVVHGGIGSQSTKTKSPRKYPAPQEDNEIYMEEVPLAALIGVPIAVLILLTGTIVWCYFMTRRHHARQHWANDVDYSPKTTDLSSKKDSQSELYAPKKAMEEMRNVSFNVYVDCPNDRVSHTKQQSRAHKKTVLPHEKCNSSRVKCDSSRVKYNSTHQKCTKLKDPPLDGLIVHNEPSRTHSNRTNHRKCHEEHEPARNEPGGFKSEIKCSGV